MATSGIVTPMPAFAPVERPEDEGDTVSEDALPVGNKDDTVSVDALLAVVDVGIVVVASILVVVVAIAEAGVSEIALVDGCEEPESPVLTMA
jgi:hypothetical protein